MRALKLIHEPWAAAAREPISATTIATAAIIASTAASAATAVYSGVQAAQQQNFQHDMAMRNADIQKAQSEAAADTARRKAERKLGQIGGAYVKAGIDPSVGSPVDVLADSAGEAALDVANIRYGGKMGVDQSYLQAAIAKSNARDAMTSGFIGAGTSLLTGATKLYSGMGSSIPVGGTPRSGGFNPDTFSAGF